MSNKGVSSSGESLFSVALVLFFVFVATLGLAGGASRADEVGQLWVRLVSLILIAALQFTPTTRSVRTMKPAFLIVGGAALLIFLQLVPLPPSIWMGLPGRQPFAEAMNIAGLPQVWRPLNITPDIGLNSFFSLAPALTMTVFMLHLRERDNATVAAAFVLLALASALMGVAQAADGGANTLRLYSITSESLPVGLFANRNHQAVLLAIALPIVVVCLQQYLQRREQRSAHVVILGAGAVAFILLGALALTGSRAGFCAGVVACIVSVIMLMRGRRKEVARRRIAIVAGAIALGSVLAVIFLSRWSLLVERLANDPFTDLRFSVLPYLIKLIQTYFPVGSGFGSFDAVYRRGEPFALLSPEYLNHAHNDLLELAIEGGLPALFGIVAITALWAISVRRAWFAQASASDQVWPQLGTVVVALLFLASLIDYPLRTPILSTLFVLGFCWTTRSAATPLARPK